MRSILAGVVIFILVAASPTWAQSDFTTMKALPGDRVFVVQPNGVEVSGVLAEMSPGEIRIDRYTFMPEAGMRIDRQGDSVWSGALIGVGVGVFLGAVLGECYHVDQWQCLGAAGATYGAFGVLLDALHQGRTTVYRGTGSRTARLVPAVTRRSAHLTLAVGF